MPKKKSRKKLIIIIIISILILLIIGLALYEENVGNIQEVTSVNDFEDIKQLIEYNECKYIKTTSSKEEGYEEDIYLEFSKDPIEENGKTNNVLYDNLTSQIAGKKLGTNFRLIDESRNIIIRIQFNENEVSLYTINGDMQYFEHLKTSYQTKNYKEDKQTPISISSLELYQIINNNWETTNLNLGTVESTCDDYDIYFDEGYKIRKIYSKVFNIVFTNKYKNEVFPNIRAGMTNEEIKSILGEPTYTDTTGYQDLIGYVNEEFYAFFSNGEISIYKNEKNYDTTEFSNILTEYIQTNDYNTLISNITNLWQDYDEYTRTKEMVSITYTLRGIKIEFNVMRNNGIKIYKNYTGQLTNDLSMDDIKNGEQIPNNIYIDLDTNLVNETESYRAAAEKDRRDPPDYDEELATDDYIVAYVETLDGGYENVSFYSRTKEKIDSELKNPYVNDLYKLDNNNFIYSVQGQGIYKYNAENLSYETIVEGTATFKIKEIKNNIIYYDNSQIQIN